MPGTYFLVGVCDNDLVLDPLHRYHRQVILEGVGVDAQRRLRGSHALIVGCGALGCAAIDLLARAGVGTLTLVDRDVVEITNLQRQSLYEESDAANGVPKAEAAKRRVNQVNRDVKVHACVEHLGVENVLEFVRDCAVIVDGLDNYRTRYMLNDAAVKLGRPYVYAGAVGTRGMCMPVLAGVATEFGLSTSDAPCLRCVFPDAPPPGGGETCDTVGVFGPVVTAVGAHAASEAIKIMAGLDSWIDRSLWQTDLRANREHRTPLAGAARSDCPCCGARKFEFLQAGAEAETAILCGSNAVQVRPRASAEASRHHATVDLTRIAARLNSHGSFVMRGSMLVGTLRDMRAHDGSALDLTIFDDGRAIVRGSTDAAFAQSVYDRLIGS